MGMFDYVDLKIKCPKCNAIVGPFQTKEKENYLNILSPNDVDGFYTSCDRCGLWIELRNDFGKTSKYRWNNGRRRSDKKNKRVTTKA